jgi:hypothetical protein
MIGELLGDELGEVTTTRVLPSVGQSPKVEVSFRANGTVLGIHCTDMGTYVASAQPDGMMFGEGQGLLQTEHGDVATWRGSGRGRFTSPGRQAWRGAIYFQTTSERLSRLNEVACVFEYEIDESGKTDSKTWEWK